MLDEFELCRVQGNGLPSDRFREYLHINARAATDRLRLHSWEVHACMA
jgi:hypothetical protein